MVAQVAEEVHYPDGRVSLASTDEISDSGYANDELTPIPLEQADLEHVQLRGDLDGG